MPLETPAMRVKDILFNPSLHRAFSPRPPLLSQRESRIPPREFRSRAPRVRWFHRVQWVHRHKEAASHRPHLDTLALGLVGRLLRRLPLVLLALYLKVLPSDLQGLEGGWWGWGSDGGPPSVLPVASTRKSCGKLA